MRARLQSKRTCERRRPLGSSSAGENPVDAVGARQQRRVRDRDADVEADLTDVAFEGRG